jgi:hypothetical protein
MLRGKNNQEEQGKRQRAKVKSPTAQYICFENWIVVSHGSGDIL